MERKKDGEAREKGCQEPEVEKRYQSLPLRGKVATRTSMSEWSLWRTPPAAPKNTNHAKAMVATS
jgi:hypothetical protein